MGFSQPLSSLSLAPGSQVGVNNAYVVQGGPNQIASLTDPTGAPLSGTVISAPDSAHAIELFAIVGTISPATTSGNSVELHSQLTPNSYQIAYRAQWAASAAQIAVGVFLGGYIMAAGQPLTYALTNAGLSDVNLSCYYRIVPFP